MSHTRPGGLPHARILWRIAPAACLLVDSEGQGALISTRSSTLVARSAARAMKLGAGLTRGATDPQLYSDYMVWTLSSSSPDKLINQWQRSVQLPHLSAGAHAFGRKKGFGRNDKTLNPNYSPCPSAAWQTPPCGPSPGTGTIPMPMQSIGRTHAPSSSSLYFLHTVHRFPPRPAPQAQSRHRLALGHLQPPPGSLPPTRCPRAHANGSSQRPPMLPARYRAIVGGHAAGCVHLPACIKCGALQDLHSMSTPWGLKYATPPFRCTFRAWQRLQVLVMPAPDRAWLQLQGSPVSS